ncbi:MAG: hypothetical protein K6A28_08105 [Bacteroidales bacterium]|nr:hypothetical protein [Bacteroidales bacterium]
MKKATRFFILAALALSMATAVACDKEKTPDNNSQGGGEETPAVVNPIRGHTFAGSMTDTSWVEYGFLFEFDIFLTAVSENKIIYSCQISNNGQLRSTDEDNISYTFADNRGTFVFERDSVTRPYTYDPAAKTITFDMAYDISHDGVLVAGGTVVLHQEE